MHDATPYGHPPVPSAEVIAAAEQLAAITVNSGETQQAIQVECVDLPHGTSNFAYQQVAQLVTDMWHSGTPSAHDWRVAYDHNQRHFVAISQRTIVPRLMRNDQGH